MVYSLITFEQTKSPISEAYRTLRTNVQFTSVDSDTQKIVVTSSGPGEGKSHTVANLAVSIAQSGKSVLIIDADLRNPTQHKLFGLDNRVGLSVCLVEDGDYGSYLLNTAVPGVRVLPAGPIPPNPAELAGSKGMKHLLAGAGEEFDMILIDTPPVIAVTDALILAQEADGVILVLASGEVDKSYAQKTKGLLDKLEIKILGAVLNKVSMNRHEYYYYNNYN